MCFVKVHEAKQESDGLIVGGKMFGGDLTALDSIRQSDAQKSSLEGTLDDMIEKGVPAYKITIPALTPYYVAKLIAYLQFEVALEGQLRGLRGPANEEGVYVDLTYLQASVEGYKQKMRVKITDMKLARERAFEENKRMIAEAIGTAI